MRGGHERPVLGRDERARPRTKALPASVGSRTGFGRILWTLVLALAAAGVKGEGAGVGGGESTGGVGSVRGDHDEHGARAPAALDERRLSHSATASCQNDCSVQGQVGNCYDLTFSNGFDCYSLETTYGCDCSGCISLGLTGCPSEANSGNDGDDGELSR